MARGPVTVHELNGMVPVGDIQLIKTMLSDAKRGFLAESRLVVAQRRSEGRFKESDKSVLTTLQTGRARARRVPSIDGIRPDQIKFPAKITLTQRRDVGKIVEASTLAYRYLRRTLPLRTGLMRRSVSTFINTRTGVFLVSPNVIKTYFSQPDVDFYDSVLLVPVVPYASAVEALYYRRQVRPSPVARAAVQIRRAFGSEISARFLYINSTNLRLSISPPRAMPVVQIGQPGAFVQNDKRPSARRRKRRSA